MAPTLDPQAQFELITAHLAEVLNPDLIKNVLEVEKRPLKVYWGTATTGISDSRQICLEMCPTDLSTLS